MRTATLVAMLLLLPAVLPYRLAATRSSTSCHLPGRARPIRCQLSKPVEAASKLLSRLMSDALLRRQKDPTAVVQTKRFLFSTAATHVRAVQSLELPAYMTLPIEEYALYDDQLMRRVGGDVFELSLPSSPNGGGLAFRPTVRVQVVQGNDATLQINSLSASLFGQPDDTLEAAGGSQQEDDDASLSKMMTGLRSVDLGFNTTLGWRAAPRDSNATELRCRTAVRLSLDLPPPFTYVPRLLVQSAANVVMRSVTELLLPQFCNLLELDFERWLNGTRDKAVAVGTLMEQADAAALPSVVAITDQEENSETLEGGDIDSV